MGRIAILVVVGMIIAVVSLAAALTSNYAEGANLRDMLVEKSQAKNIAAVVSGAYVRQLKQDPTVSGRYQIRDFMNGEAVVDVEQTGSDTYLVKTVAQYRSAHEEVQFRVSGIRGGNPVVTNQL